MILVQPSFCGISMNCQLFLDTIFMIKLLINLIFWIQEKILISLNIAQQIYITSQKKFNILANYFLM